MGKYWTCDKEWVFTSGIRIRCNVGRKTLDPYGRGWGVLFWMSWLGLFCLFLMLPPPLGLKPLKVFVWRVLISLCEWMCLYERKKKYKKAFSLLCFVLCFSEKICASMWNTAFIVPYILFGRTADWFGCWRSHVTFYRSKLTSKSQVACVEAH